MFPNTGVGPGAKKRSAPPPPFGAREKKPGIAIAIGVGKPKGGPSPEEEANESPDEENQEEYGKKLIDDIVQAGASVGIHDPKHAKMAAAAFMRAIAECLEQEDGSSGEPAEEGTGEEMTGGEEGY
jgi:hypothetical protein